MFLVEDVVLVDVLVTLEEFEVDELLDDVV
ncbi:hypothetical protein ACUW83_001323 [Staphylococcus hominis]